MSKFHLNPKGEPGPCRAEKNCPFGGPEMHFSSKEEARLFYEQNQNTFAVDKYALMTDAELEATEVALLAERTASKTPITDDEYERHYEYIRRVRRSHPSTHKKFTVRSKYPAVRAALHDEIIAELLKEYSSLPSDGKVLFVGGISGSGKSTMLRTHPELNGKDYFPSNPDLIKEKMIERSMEPKIPGLLPMETDELIRFEATVINNQLFL